MNYQGFPAKLTERLVTPAPDLATPAAIEAGRYLSRKEAEKASRGFVRGIVGAVAIAGAITAFVTGPWAAGGERRGNSVTCSISGTHCEQDTVIIPSLVPETNR